MKATEAGKTLMLVITEGTDTGKMELAFQLAGALNWRRAFADVP